MPKQNSTLTAVIARISTRRKFHFISDRDAARAIKSARKLLTDWDVAAELREYKSIDDITDQIIGAL